MSLVIRDINKSFTQGGQKIQVLKNLNLKLETAQVVAILGESGSGKSTLLAIMAGLDSADSGEILYDNNNILNLNQSELAKFRAKNIGIVFQQFHLLAHLSALENVALALEIIGESDSQKKALDLLTRVGLGERVNHKPSELSGGECQRVAIARAMVANPKIILADEPSGNLDSDTGQRVMDLFLDRVRAEKITTILVTHSLELAKRCDRIFKLSKGVLNEI